MISARGKVELFIILWKTIFPRAVPIPAVLLREFLWLGLMLSAWCTSDTRRWSSCAESIPPVEAALACACSWLAWSCTLSLSGPKLRNRRARLWALGMARRRSKFLRSVHWASLCSPRRSRNQYFKSCVEWHLCLLCMRPKWSGGTSPGSGHRSLVQRPSLEGWECSTPRRRGSLRGSDLSASSWTRIVPWSTG